MKEVEEVKLEPGWLGKVIDDTLAAADRPPNWLYSPDPHMPTPMNNHDLLIKQCFDLIREYYGDQRAKRSGVPYIRHIAEGLIVLYVLKASHIAKAAYCIHPMVQDDEHVVANIPKLFQGFVSDRSVLMTAMEYRNVANRGLSCYQVDNPDSIYLGPFKDVHDMLVADKVQNRKDFLKYHYGKHEKSIELDRYFRNWLRALGVTEAKYNELVAAIEA